MDLFEESKDKKGGKELVQKPLSTIEQAQLVRGTVLQRYGSWYRALRECCRDEISPYVSRIALHDIIYEACGEPDIDLPGVLEQLMLGEGALADKKKTKKKDDEDEPTDEEQLFEGAQSAPTVSARGVLFRIVATEEYDDMRILYNALLTEYGAGADRFWEALVRMEPASNEQVLRDTWQELMEFRLGIKPKLAWLLFDMLHRTNDVIVKKDLEHFATFMSKGEKVGRNTKTSAAGGASGGGDSPTKTEGEGAVLRFREALAQSSLVNSIPASWRLYLDPQGKGWLSFTEFVMACRIIGFRGYSIEDLWRILLGATGKSVLTYRHLDFEGWRDLRTFHQAAVRKQKRLGYNPMTAATEEEENEEEEQAAAQAALEGKVCSDHDLCLSLGRHGGGESVWFTARDAPCGPPSPEAPFSPAPLRLSEPAL